MSKTMNPEYESVRANLEAGKKQADKVYQDQLMNAKQPAIAALSQSRITLEQYAELVGETFADTVAEQFRRRVAIASDEVKVRMDNGLLTQDEYDAIVGGVQA